METLRIIVLIIGYVWLLAVGGMVAYLLLPMLLGMSGTEEITQPIFMGLIWALPGLLLVHIGRREP